MPAVAADGRTVLSYSIYYRWFGNTSRETFVIDQVYDAGKQAIRLEIALAFLALLLIRLVWQSWLLSTAKLLMKQALDTAARASEEKSQFLSTMSLEIRTPVSGLIGRAILLSRFSLKPERREEVESISESGRALLGIIDDALDFSQIEAGGTASIPFQPFRRSAVSTSRRHGGTGFGAGDMSKMGGGDGRANRAPEQPGGKGGVLVQTARDERKAARGGK